jgi:acetyl-CoA synthetase
MTDIIWSPSDSVVQNANITRFMKKHGIADYGALIERSTADVAWFWDAALADVGIRWETPYETVMDESEGFPWTKWFLGGRLSIVDNCLDRHAADPERRDWTALIWEREDGKAGELTFAELAARTTRVAEALESLGVGKGDAVGLYMPMVPDMVATFFGILKLGAVVVPVFSAFGPQALATRLEDAGARVLVTADGAARRGKVDLIKERADAAREQTPGLEHVLVKRNLSDEELPAGGLPWNDATDKVFDELVDAQPGTRDTEIVEAEDRAMIIFTSGTTGRPKGTVHTHAGCLAQMGKELCYNFDVKPGDRFFWFTDIGWMMGPWMLIGANALGAAATVYDGSPDRPDPGRVWAVVERHRLTHLGISPTLIRMLMRSDVKYAQAHDTSSLRMLGSTGEPWDPVSYDWFFEHAGKRRCPIINISGGTEIVGCLLAPLPIHPLKPCTLQGPGLGMAVDVFDEEGNPIRGGIGHLVCKRPAPSMTKGFLNDPERYLDTYFSRWDDIWYHGDWARVDEDGYWFLQGRSDDTVNVGGKRVGPAEFESTLISHPAVSEACAFGVPHELKGESVICLVVLAPGHEATEALRAELMDTVIERMGKPLKPDAIKVVSELPKTRSAKIVRGSIRKVYLGEGPGDTSSIANPGAFEAIGQAK